ncbi:MAG: DUF4186 domain-containing protein [Sedimentisphaerales bacterium]|nr:DUF4186 domain-containing protein [Sedimentisphaerales bacterium]
MDELFAALARSGFRSRFRLGQKERAYLHAKGMETIRKHAYDFIRQRLVPPHPVHDGKQTPMRGHPVFIAQHATGTCCRNCLAKWHNFPIGSALNEEQIKYIETVIRLWIQKQS